TRTGWALVGLDGSRVDSGSFRCASTVAVPCRWARWLDHLGDVCPPSDRLAAIAVEKPITYGGRGRSADAARVLFGLMAQLELWAHRRSLSIAEVPPARVKKLAAGKGNAAKHDVLD